MAFPAQIKTRCLVISDTHGRGDLFKAFLRNEVFDVAIHCGDLTEKSYLSEFKATIDLLASVNAKLKLVIAGNHDWTLDVPCFRRKLEGATYDPGTSKPDEISLQGSPYGDFGEARALIDDAKRSGIVLLDEGNHQFVLDNGARLKVYASPFTPAMDSDNSNEWGFQYDPNTGHRWNIAANTDVMITHGPPKNILDSIPNTSGIPDEILNRLTEEQKARMSGKLGNTGPKHAGCPKLFQAVARARPKLHCFGHIHTGWGRQKVVWQADTTSTKPNHLKPSTGLAQLQGHVEHQSTTYSGRRGETTLFVNAAIQGDDLRPVQPAWIVNVDLNPA